jgi:glycosyltransferase involved in cell wall biosynthesis
MSSASVIHVTLLPSVSPDDLPALYGSCLVAIAPGTGHPPGGMFLLQALASGLPVIAHPSAGMHEWIHQGVEGIIVEVQEVPAFAAAVAAMLIDPHARIAFGESGRLAALESHDFTRTVAMLEEIYRSCGNSGRAAAA